MNSNSVLSPSAASAAHSKIPVFILAGGLGTRISEETTLKPKPMVEVGEIPVLVHLMRWYYSFGFNDFVICAGYKSWEIKQYFLDYEFRTNHIQIDHRATLDCRPTALSHSDAQEKWRIRVIDTGLDTMTGGRIAKAFDLVTATDRIETFAVTYGDGLSDVDLASELAFHRKGEKIGTVLGVKPAARFGELDVNAQGQVSQFLEKPQSKQGLINGGFFFFEKGFRRYLSPTPECILERAPLANLASDGELLMFPHEGFWQPMDTLRDKTHLQEIWDAGKAPWFRR
jgi:glucose-1-phosphate cytidylyltransferase